MTARKRDRPLSARLAELGDAVIAAQQRVREMEAESVRVKASVDEATEGIVEAHAAGNMALAEKLSTDRERLEGSAVRDAGERVEGASRALMRAEAERGLFAVESIDGLLAEIEPDARAAASAVEEAVEQLGHAQARWNAVQADVAAVLRIAGQSTQLPQFPERLATLVREAKRAGGVGVPAPVPPSLPSIRKAA
jgi:hypothetical protein